MWWIVAGAGRLLDALDCFVKHLTGFLQGAISITF
jgi:hypothetical protein